MKHIKPIIAIIALILVSMVAVAAGFAVGYSYRPEKPALASHENYEPKTIKARSENSVAYAPLRERPMPVAAPAPAPTATDATCTARLARALAELEQAKGELSAFHHQFPPLPDALLPYADAIRVYQDLQRNLIDLASRPLPPDMDESTTDEQRAAIFAELDKPDPPERVAARKVLDYAQRQLRERLGDEAMEAYNKMMESPVFVPR